MKEISLTRSKIGLIDKVALVDDEDYEWLSRWRWQAKKHRNTWYAVRARRKDGKKTTISMHQEILGKKLGYVIDHKDGNGLNNQRNNLRHVTTRQNAQNRHAPTSSKYPGVSWNKKCEKWIAGISQNGQQKYLGAYTNEMDAFKIYQAAVKQLTGEEVKRGD